MEQKGALMDILDEVRKEPTYANHCRVLERIQAADYKLPGPGRRVGLLSNFTVAPIVTCLRVQSYLNAFPMDLYVGRYNEYAQEILDEGSGLHSFAPDIVLMILMPESVMPGVIGEPWQDSDVRRRLVDEGLERLTGLAGALRKRSKATILISNLVAHELSPLGVLEWQEPIGIDRAMQEFNHRLGDWVQAQKRIHVLDLAGVCAAFGRERAFDPRMRLLADQPFATPFLPRLAMEIFRYLRATTGPSRKCLVLDLDNTLWGGILGEDGPEGLRLGGDAVGVAYREFQKSILALQSRGILLALCSRNDEAEAMQVIENHPEMVLRPDHFAAARINWNDKVSNIKSLAEELNIGLDSFVYVDDDPFERQNVRERLPEVLVVDLPDDPVFYRSTLLNLSVFDALHVSAEDRARGRMYLERRGHEKLKTEAASLEEYLKSLEMEIKIVLPEGAARTRLFQMVHKTNQFNLTTPRYSEAEFEALAKADDHQVFGVSVRDRLGDSGIVGLVVLGMDQDRCQIQTFLLSCRVLGRSIETAILAHVLEKAREARAARIIGRYIPTQKNGIVRDLYQRHGFQLVNRDEKAEIWEACLSGFRLEAPPWARVRNS